MKQTYNDRFIGWIPDKEIYLDHETGEEITLKELDPDLYVIKFGKYAGQTLKEINEEDPSYIEWLKMNEDVLLNDCINNL